MLRENVTEVCSVEDILKCWKDFDPYWRSVLRRKKSDNVSFVVWKAIDVPYPAE